MTEEISRLHLLNMHEEMEINAGSYTNVIRVPGGWIYSFYTEQVGGHFSRNSVFVPMPEL